MTRHLWRVAIFLALLGALGGCETATAIPAGAQQVEVDATGPAVILRPATVHAGDVYLVVDLPENNPQGPSLVLVEGTGGPLTDADLARYTQTGDEQGKAFVIIDNSCCGKVHRETFAAGKYAFVLEAEGLPPGVPPSAVTVLQVTP